MGAGPGHGFRHPPHEGPPSSSLLSGRFTGVVVPPATMVFRRQQAARMTLDFCPARLASAKRLRSRCACSLPGLQDIAMSLPRFATLLLLLALAAAC